MSDLSEAELSKFSKLFAALSAPGRQTLMSRSSKRRYEAGAELCREGDEAADFFVIATGTVQVSCDDLGTEKALATLGAGQFFGELALLSGKKREATVRAAGPVEVIAFPIAAVSEVLKGAPDAMVVLQKAGLARAEDSMKKLMSL
jgi:CRP-like cAMP-binding protein